MNAYRFAVRSSTLCGLSLHTDVAVSQPPGDLEPVLLRHELQPLAGRIAAVGKFESDDETRQAHDDLVTLLHIVDALGLRIPEDQGLAYRNRRLGVLLNQPLVLADDEGNDFILDIRPLGESFHESRPITWQQSDPLLTIGRQIAYVGELTDGSIVRLSSTTGDVLACADRVNEWL